MTNNSVKNVKKGFNFNKFQVTVVKTIHCALNNVLFLFAKNIMPMELVKNVLMM